MKRATVLTTIAGAVIMLLGLLALGSTLNDSELGEMRAAGMLIMAFGAMVIAVPMYIDARGMIASKKEAKQAALRKGASRCIVCAEEIASFWCTSHSVGVCMNCIAEHHDNNRCLYKPIVAQLPKAAGATRSH